MAAAMLMTGGLIGGRAAVLANVRSRFQRLLQLVQPLIDARVISQIFDLVAAMRNGRSVPIKGRCNERQATAEANVRKVHGHLPGSDDMMIAPR